MHGASDTFAREALVVFVDDTRCAWLRLLRPGFRHCFAALRDGAGWLLCDPLKDHMLLTRIDAAGFELGRFYASQGHRVLAGDACLPPRRRRALLPAPLTCVGVVKRLLGVQAAAVLTPWQLFRHLTERPEDAFRPVE